MVKREKPKEDIGDVAVKICRGSIQEISIFGGIIAEFIETPFEKNFKEYVYQISEDVQELIEERKISKDNLFKNPLFQETLLKSLKIAQYTMDEDKRKLLRNAILNSACYQNFDTSLIMIFLNLIDIFSINHFKTLDFITDPHAEKYREEVEYFSKAKITKTTITVVINRVFHVPGGKEYITFQILNDLQRYDLIEFKYFNTSISLSSILRNNATRLGEDLILYISENKS